MTSLAYSALAAFVLLAFTSPTVHAAAAGANATCDAALVAHMPAIPNTVCDAVDGKCPAGCLAAFENLENFCAGQKYSHKKDIDGKSVEVALDWDTDKASYLIEYQSKKNVLGREDVCLEVIHDYQIKHINDCDEAHHNAALDVTLGYFCGVKSSATTCAPECQESIDKMESVCNPKAGPTGQYLTTADDDVTTVNSTYSVADMAAFELLGPAGCKYVTSLSGAASVSFSVTLFVTMLAMPLFLLA